MIRSPRALPDATSNARVQGAELGGGARRLATAETRPRYADGPWEGPVPPAAGVASSTRAAPHRNGEVALRAGARSAGPLPSLPPASTAAPPTIEWLRAAVPELEKEIVEQMTEDMIASSSWRTRENTHPSLSNSVCTGATLHLQRLLKDRGVSLDLERRSTRARMDSVEALHIYLWAKNYCGPDQHLIIDPTVRQFFRDTLDAEQLATIPAIFIGTEQELEALFLEKFTPTPVAPKLDAQAVVKVYLNTRAQSKEW